jgi:hypothetical protein
VTVDRWTLRAGDVLLYRPKGVFGWIIAIKTWHSVAHVEAWNGKQAVASRDGIGVGYYPFRRSDLCAIVRPRRQFNIKTANYQFESNWRGQGYDWFGLLRFAWRAPVDATKFNNKQFCSELITRWLRAGGLDPFNGEDADAIAPFQFLLSPVFRKVEIDDDTEVEG